MRVAFQTERLDVYKLEIDRDEHNGFDLYLAYERAENDHPYCQVVDCSTASGSNCVLWVETRGRPREGFALELLNGIRAARRFREPMYPNYTIKNLADTLFDRHAESFGSAGKARVLGIVPIVVAGASQRPATESVTTASSGSRRRCLSPLRRRNRSSGLTWTLAGLGCLSLGTALRFVMARSQRKKNTTPAKSTSRIKAANLVRDDSPRQEEGTFPGDDPAPTAKTGITNSRKIAGRTASVSCRAPPSTGTSMPSKSTAMTAQLRRICGAMLPMGDILASLEAGRR